VRQVTGLKAGVNESELPGRSLFIINTGLEAGGLDDFGAVAF